MSRAAQAMADALHHRGPDDSGVWAAEDGCVALGFRRLAIIDLSENGHQPMRSGSGRFMLVFNGEVYNHPALADELAGRGYSFRGHSDTEVILAAFEEWGIEEAVSRFVGMFAMAVWDHERRELCLIRDRLGIKPLFVYQGNGIVAFASELKALHRLPEFRPEVDIEGLAAYFRYLYVPAPGTIYRGVTKLLPGHLLTIGDARSSAASRPYWSVADVAQRGRCAPFQGDDHEAVDAVDAALLDAVRLRMRADVPVGAFLSGGVDSSTVVALMQEVSPRPVRTFTIGFDRGQHDESSEAAAVARYLGTEHSEIRLSGDDALKLVPAMPTMFDEPLADPSQLPTYLICRAAREDVTVAISGDGGDELFAGYNRYVHGERTIRRAARVPSPARRYIAAGLSSVAPQTWDRLHDGATSLLRLPRQRLPGEKMHKLASLLREPTTAHMYRSLLSAWQEPPIAGHAGDDARAAAVLADPSLSMIDRMMLADQQSYLPDDLLAKVDRTSMAVSLEVRVPILDHRVVELSWQLPAHLRLRDGRGKWPLRQVLERRVPRELIDRPKVGFSVPLADWLRGPLRSWADGLLAPDRLRATPELDIARIRAEWQQFVEGRSNSHLALWTVLMYEAWRERWAS